MAQGPDVTPPTITIVTPVEGASYEQGTPVTASYSCADESSGVPSCDGPVASGSAISTSTIGNFTFTVLAKDAAGNTQTATRHYSVVGASGEVGGGTAATLNLTLGTPAAFSPFIPGIGKDYTTSMTATLTSTAADATLWVADPSATATGRLMNGTFALAAPLQVGATSPNGVSSPMADVGGSAAPTKLLTYAGPLGAEAATLNFKQSIAATEALRTGGYAKTLTFTLSTTTP
ncbi:hypothetical protein [Solirubrobacter ginsenosidimutans]|uniref:hypothetical protein n=1 Tax=Solirubrobacter ginsenosidimutans TaxID=490573 RepID=UPI0022CDDA65|nr:hypothetical protein [Solirubrobacter ginsenosidimutans]